VTAADQQEEGQDGCWQPLSGGDARQPLHGLRVVDFTQMGPGPFATTLLSAWGADVITVVRPLEVEAELGGGHFNGGRRRIGLDLKKPEGADLARRLARGADVVAEGFRPGAMERLGLGPADLREGHEELIYLRLTGYGQTGPYARRAGHDINYLAVSGALSAIGRGEPAPPLAMLGDFAGGAMSAVLGILLALRERERTSAGTVIDAAIVDGVAQLFYSTAAQQDGGARVRLLDGTAPFYATYPCADGRRMSVGALEARFFARLLQLMGIDEPEFVARQYDVTAWAAIRSALASRFASKSRAEWDKILSQGDTCAAPVVEAGEVLDQEHLAGRGTYSWDGGLRVARAPRLDSVPPVDLPPAAPASPAPVLEGLGLTPDEVDRLRRDGVIGGLD
jgi:alpha-methylacyl-CoA racemase